MRAQVWGVLLRLILMRFIWTWKEETNSNPYLKHNIDAEIVFWLVHWIFWLSLAAISPSLALPLTESLHLSTADATHNNFNLAWTWGRSHWKLYSGCILSSLNKRKVAAGFNRARILVPCMKHDMNILTEKIQGPYRLNNLFRPFLSLCLWCTIYGLIASMAIARLVYRAL